MLKLRRKFMLYAPIEDGNDLGGGHGYEDTTPPEANPETPQESGDSDDYGYDEVPAEEGKQDPNAKVDDKSKQTPAAKPDDKKPVDDKKPADPGTGYLDDKGEVKNDEKPVEEKPAGDKKPAEETKPEEGEEFLKEVKFDEVRDEDKKTLSEYIKKHKIPKEAAQALVDIRKEEVAKIKQMVADNDARLKQLEEETKRGWIKELKEDPEFGGENFAHSIKQAEKAYGQFFKNTKNKLTAGGKMVPPYLMKDLLALSKQLYSKEKFDPKGSPIPDSNDNNPDEHLDFYE